MHTRNFAPILNCGLYSLSPTVWELKFVSPGQLNPYTRHLYIMSNMMLAKTLPWSADPTNNV